jgi:hypothetical protein
MTADWAACGSEGSGSTAGARRQDAHHAALSGGGGGRTPGMADRAERPGGRVRDGLYGGVVVHVRGRLRFLGSVPSRWRVTTSWQAVLLKLPGRPEGLAGPFSQITAFSHHTRRVFLGQQIITTGFIVVELFTLKGQPSREVRGHVPDGSPDAPAMAHGKRGMVRVPVTALLGRVDGGARSGRRAEASRAMATPAGRRAKMGRRKYPPKAVQIHQGRSRAAYRQEVVMTAAGRGACGPGGSGSTAGAGRQDARRAARPGGGGGRTPEMADRG